MNRQAQRQIKREIEKIKPDTLQFIDNYYKKQAEENLSIFKKIVDDAVFSAMRENHISEERANRIIELAGEYIKQGVNNAVKS